MSRLASTLPEGDQNGLAAITRQLADTPHEVHVLVALIDCKTITTNLDTGDVIPTARILACEILDGKDGTAVQKMLDRKHTARTGLSKLSFELVDGGVDPATGEISGPS